MIYTNGQYLTRIFHFYGIIFAFLLIQPELFSQSDNISLDQCLHAAEAAHPLQENRARLDMLANGRDELIRLERYPAVEWSAQGKIQSESIGLSFDNPMFPAIEIPLYGAQSSLDLTYIIYEGGINRARRQLNRADSEWMINQLETSIDPVRREVLTNYLGILYVGEKEAVLRHSLKRVNDHIQRLESALAHGIVTRQEIDQLRIKALELEGQIQATVLDKSALIGIMKNLTGMDLTANTRFDRPVPYPVNPDDPVMLKTYEGLDLQIKKLDFQKELAGAGHKPRFYGFLSGGIGYPNPLNFFEDEISPYALGGLGFSWNFIDWGKTKKEQQLLRIQQEMLQTQKRNIDEQLNRYTDKYLSDLEKYSLLIETEKKVLQMRQAISEVQKSKLENGIIVPVEYLDTVNEIIDSELRLNQFELDKLRIGLEYALAKGNL